MEDREALFVEWELDSNTCMQNTTELACASEFQDYPMPLDVVETSVNDLKTYEQSFIVRTANENR